MSKDLKYYRGLPYSLKVDQFEEAEDGETYYRAVYEEMPQVKGVHQDRLLAIKLAKELFDSYVEAQLAWGEEIPEPAVKRFRKRGGLYKFSVDATSPSSSSGASSVQQDTKQHRETKAEAAGHQFASGGV